MVSNFDQSFKRKVLVIEDDDLNRSILKEILVKDYDVIEAENGKVGLEMLNTYKISLILLDIQMPIMNGFTFLKELHKSKSLSMIPVIVTTSAKEDEEKCLEYGASDFVSKPYSPNIILKRVAALIRLAESVLALKETQYDQLTNLYNRNYFDYAINNLRRELLNEKIGIILFNIEDFQFINATYGEEDGDRFLRHIGEVLNALNYDDVITSRYGSERFAIAFKLNHHNTMDIIEKVDKEIINNSPIKNIHIKYAYYLNPSKSLSCSKIMSNLFDTLKSIQHDYLNKTIEFKDDMLLKENRKRFITSTMEKSLNNDEFIVYYQPKHDAYTNKLVGAEALVRWKHPKIGMISPGEFIPTFEENGFITQLDKHVFEQVCKDLKLLKDKNIAIVPVSINFSRRDLAIIESLDYVNSIINKYNIDKEYIHFEITESICGQNKDVLTKAKMIRDGGIKIEIDDFGSGYSTLGMITDIPMDYLKLDISFARNLMKQKEVIRSMINLAHILGVKTVAEGVENKEQLEVYKELKIDYVQGFVFSKSMPLNEFTNYIKKYN